MKLETRLSSRRVGGPGNLDLLDDTSILLPVYLRLFTDLTHGACHTAMLDALLSAVGSKSGVGARLLLLLLQLTGFASKGIKGLVFVGRLALLN